MNIAKRFIFTLFATTIMLAIGMAVLFLPSMFIGYHFGVAWMVVYLVVAVSFFIAISER